MKRNAILMTLTSLLVLGGEPSDAEAEGQSGTSGPNLIPIVVPATREPSGYIIPNCSKCKKLKLERQSTATGGTQGVLGLTYHDEQGEFIGDLELTVVFVDESEQVVTVEGVWLVEDEQATWMIEGLDWDTVDTVWLELVPAA